MNPVSYLKCYLYFICLHLVAWLSYTVYFYLHNWLENPNVTWGASIAAVLYFAFVFYVVYAILRRFAKRRRWWKAIVAIILFYVASSAISYTLVYHDYSRILYYGQFIVEDYDFSWREFIQFSLLMHGNFTVFAILYFQIEQRINAVVAKNQEMERRLEAEQKRAQYEYAALSAEVSPHMMTNVFRIWRDELQESNAGLSNQIGQMHELMKIYMGARMLDGPQMVLLKEEITSARTYLVIQKEVARQAIFVDWQVSGNTSSAIIPPTAVLSLIENALKYGDLTDPDHPLSIMIAVDREGFYVEVSNRKAHGVQRNKGYGTGLERVRRRLELSFPNSYTWEVLDHNERFAVRLTIKFHQKLE